MKQLLESTAAYKILKSDAESGRLSHAYLLYLQDEYCLRDALKYFARAFFGAEEGSRDARLIEAESLTDCKIYPPADKKLTAELAAEIVSDAAIKPVEHESKLYVITAFESASPIVQNKLLKSLEEPPRGVHFLLGATSLAPVLDTVKSRVKLLEVAPFSPACIFEALEREEQNPQNASAAAACGGSLGVARNILRGEWFNEVRAAAGKLCAVTTLKQATALAWEYGDFKYKRELLFEMQQIYLRELKKYADDENYEGPLSRAALVRALDAVNSAYADLKFNANFSSLVYDLLIRVLK